MSCQFCQHRGGSCLYCEGERDKAYDRAFPNGPQPIATFDLTNPADVEKARNILGPENLTKHFKAGGDGIEGLMKDLATKLEPLS